MGRATIIALAAVAALGCEEVYTECEADRAPSDFPDATDRFGQCLAVCDHLAEIGCGLGCPYLPDGGLDAGVQASELDCMSSCLEAVDTVRHPELDEDALTRGLRCYAGTKTCRQVGACSRLCGADEARVWPAELLCVDR